MVYLAFCASTGRGPSSLVNISMLKQCTSYDHVVFITEVTQPFSIVVDGTYAMLLPCQCYCSRVWDSGLPTLYEGRTLGPHQSLPAAGRKNHLCLSPQHLQWEHSTLSPSIATWCTSELKLALSSLVPDGFHSMSVLSIFLLIIEATPSV